MTAARIIRFILGVVIAAALLMVVLPYVGIPSSHFLPPEVVWRRSQKEVGNVTLGTVVTKYYDVTNNPFNVGGKLYFVEYQFKAKSLMPSGQAAAGKPQVYNGTIEVPQAAYDGVGTTADQQTLNNTHEQMKLPAKPGQRVRVLYELTYPYINGVIAPQPLYGRNIGEGSGNITGWLLWVLLALVLGYFVMLLLERFANKENL